MCSSSNKDGICKIRELDERELYSVLISTTKSKPFRSSSKVYDHLVNDFNKMLKFKRHEALEWFFTNTTRALRDGFSGFSVKLTAAYWSGNDCGIGYVSVKSVIDFMTEEGYVRLLKGSKDYRNEKYSYVSIVRFNQKLLDLLDKDVIELFIPSEGLEYPIILKDRKTKEVVELEKTETVQAMADEMNRYNESLSSVDIRFDGKVVPLLQYQRTFSGDINSGGRLFANGGSIQLVPQALRLSAITIDDESVEEWDYSANHPRILLELLSKEDRSVLHNVSADFDPYDVQADYLNIDHLLLEQHKIEHHLETYNPVRTLMKHAVMRALNCDDFDRAWTSLSRELYLDSKRDKTDKQFVGLIKPDCKLVMNAVCKHNQVISKYFFEDKGIWLQNLDSEIALRVIDLMLQYGEVVLCWHDSFQCRKSAGKLLQSAMKEAWGDVLGTDRFCKIDQKKV